MRLLHKKNKGFQNLHYFLLSLITVGEVLDFWPKILACIGHIAQENVFFINTYLGTSC